MPCPTVPTMMPDSDSSTDSFLPCLSAMYPNSIAPKGRAINVMAKAAHVARESPRKKLMSIWVERYPKTENSYLPPKMKGGWVCYK